VTSRATSPNQLPLGFTRDVRSPEERRIDSMLSGYMAHVTRTHRAGLTRRQELDWTLAADVDMGLISRDERDAIMSRYDGSWIDATD
jgi:hypothetical protein